MQQVISKSQFKPKALAYLRDVQEKKKSMVITHYGDPVVKIVPYEESEEDVFDLLKGAVGKYEDPTEPVEVEWEGMK